jgi:Mg2+ and Co2+ transporter CorA
VPVDEALEILGRRARVVADDRGRIAASVGRPGVGGAARGQERGEDEPAQHGPILASNRRIFAAMIDVVLPAKTGATPLWIDVSAPTAEEIAKLATDYPIPLAAREECLAPRHLPKHERLEDVTFVIARTYDENSAPDADAFLTLTRKLAFFLGEGFLVTVHQRPLPYLESVKERVKKEVDAAIAKEVFGSPFFIVDGEPFWGGDRMAMLAWWTGSKDA